MVTLLDVPVTSMAGSPTPAPTAAPPLIVMSEEPSTRKGWSAVTTNPLITTLCAPDTMNPLSTVAAWEGSLAARNVIGADAVPDTEIVVPA